MIELVPIGVLVLAALAGYAVYAILRSNRMVNSMPRHEDILIDETAGDLCRWCCEDIWPVHAGKEWVDDHSGMRCLTGDRPGDHHEPLGLDSEGRRAGEPA